MNMSTGHGGVTLQLATRPGFGCGLLGDTLFLYVLTGYLVDERLVAGFTTKWGWYHVFSALT